MDQISKLFEDKTFVNKVKEKLPYLFQIAEIECSRAGKIGMEVGFAREKILIALLIDYFGKDKVKTTIPITKTGIDIIVDSLPIYIKTISGKSGVKINWTVDITRSENFVENYSPSSEILLVRINWGMKKSNKPSGLFWIPLETQNKILERVGKERYLNLPKPGTNPRGIELSKYALELLLKDEETKHIDIVWKRISIDYNPYKRWVDLWKQ